MVQTGHYTEVHTVQLLPCLSHHLPLPTTHVLLQLVMSQGSSANHWSLLLFAPKIKAFINKQRFNREENNECLKVFIYGSLCC